VKVTIVGGAGAMGGVWAGRLHKGGHEVAILDVSPEALAAIARDGLIVEEKDGGETSSRLPATDDATAIGPSEAIIFFTKAHHTASAAERARPLVDDRTTVVSLQNGWGNSDTLAGIFPAAQIVMGVTYHSAKVVAPGRIAHTNPVGSTYVGPYVDGAAMERAHAIAELLVSGGFETTATPDVKTEVWKKLILNCATLPTASLTRLTSGAIGATEELLQVCDALATEATAVARALGLEIEADERTSFIRGLLARGGAGKASMLQDVEAQRKTEIEVVNGAIVREGDRLGIPTPLNRAMMGLIHGLERSWQS